MTVRASQALKPLQGKQGGVLGTGRVRGQVGWASLGIAGHCWASQAAFRPLGQGGVLPPHSQPLGALAEPPCRDASVAVWGTRGLAPGQRGLRGGAEPGLDRSC